MDNEEEEELEEEESDEEEGKLIEGGGDIPTAPGAGQPSTTADFDDDEMLLGLTADDLALPNQPGRKKVCDQYYIHLPGV